MLRYFFLTPFKHLQLRITSKPLYLISLSTCKTFLCFNNSWKSSKTQNQQQGSGKRPCTRRSVLTRQHRSDNLAACSSCFVSSWRWSISLRWDAWFTTCCVILFVIWSVDCFYNKLSLCLQEEAVPLKVHYVTFFGYNFGYVVLHY